MLPSISSGHYGIASEPVCASKSVHESNKVNNLLPDSFEEEDRSWPSLPLISEGSFTSLVSRKSVKSLEKGREMITKCDEVYSSGQDFDLGRSGLKTMQLQLNCEMKSLDRGWCPQGINNPRLANSSRSCQLPTMGLHVMSTSERLLFEQSQGQPVESHLHKMNHQVHAAVDRNKYQMTLGWQPIINKSYRMPAIGHVVSPSKQDVSAIVPRAPQSNPVNLNRKQATIASKPLGIVIHSRCCCQHHREDNHQKAALKSKSFDSLTKERVFKGKKEVSVTNQNIHGNTFRNEKRVKATDRPPPTKLPSSGGFIVGQPRRKSKRANVLPSDSTSSIQEDRKRVKKSTPKQIKQKCLKSPESKSAEILPALTNPMEESTKELAIRVENIRHSPVCEDVSKEPEELMEVECLDDENESENREQPDNLDVISVRSVTCDQQRSATPRLLKVASEVKTDPALAQVFRKLDADRDGHISFPELKKSLPPHLSSHQINYLKKIYDMACESTFFGFEEFTATHHMCGLFINLSPVVSLAMDNLDLSTLEDWLTAFMESFTRSDKSQSGIIDLQSFVKMLASVINVHPNSFIIQKILDSLGKSKDDTISGVELLTYIPYLVAVAPKDN